MECLRSDSFIKRVALESRAHKKTHQTNWLKKGFYGVCAWSLWPRLFRSYCERLVVNEQTITVRDLPTAFEHYRILFLSDLHLEIAPNALPTLLNITLPEHDIVVLGGDFFDRSEHVCERTLRSFLTAFTKPIYAVLGNHDNSELLVLLESLGITVLLNSHVELKRGGDTVLLTGVDDVSQFRTPLQRQCAVNAQHGFKGCKIMISHSPDFLLDAAECGYSLQLSGHTHGGQFVLFDHVLFKQTKYDFATAGRWQYKGMEGFTSTGFGSSRYPIRNITPEAALITLRRAS